MIVLIRTNFIIRIEIQTMFLFLNLIHLRPCRVDLLVTCLSSQSAMIGDTIGIFVSSLHIILMNCIQVIPDY